MSVLLEALKKAAEEKKQQAEKQSREDVALPTTDENSNNVVDSGATLPQSSAFSEIADSHEVDQEPIGASESGLNSSLKIVSQQTSESNKDIDELIDQTEVPAVATQSVYQKSKEMADLDLDVRSPETASAKLSLSSEVQDESEIDETSKSAQDAHDQKHSHITATEQADKEQDDQDEWSMDKLPAYVPVTSSSSGQQVRKEVQPASIVDSTESKSLAENSILTRNALSKPSKSKSSFVANPKMLWGLGTLTTVFCIVLYSAFYFDEQNQLLESSFDKYKITPIAVNLPEKDETETALNTNSTDNLKELDSAAEVASERGGVETEGGNAANLLPSTPAQKVSMRNEAKTKSITGSSKIRTPQKERTRTATKIKTNANMLVMKTNYSTIYQPKPQLNISRSQQVTNEQKLLGEAYTLFEARKWLQAKSAFTSVLGVNSQNLTALLGVAASERNLNNLEAALQSYQKVLKENPGNRFALDALAEIANDMTSPSDKWLTQLQNLAEKNKNSSVLQNALGNLMSKRSEWYKAQQYYFQAVVLNAQEAVYLMNLAVSLDHLGKYTSASDYYKKALVYSNGTGVIDENAIKGRLVTLKRVEPEY